MKTVYFNVYPVIQEVLEPFYPVSVPNYLQIKKHQNFVLLAKIIFPGKKIDFQILLLTLKGHHRRYENRLF